MGGDTSSVWSFFDRPSDVISRGNQWWRREMSAVFSGDVRMYTVPDRYLYCKTAHFHGIFSTIETDATN